MPRFTVDVARSLLNGYECRAYFKFCTSSPTMVTTPYEWNILECDPNKQTNKQTDKQTNKQTNKQNKQTNIKPITWTHSFILNISKRICIDTCNSITVRNLWTDVKHEMYNITGSFFDVFLNGTMLSIDVS